METSRSAEVTGQNGVVLIRMGTSTNPRHVAGAMKFELMELPEPDVPVPAAEPCADEAGEPEPREDALADPVAGINAAAERLTAHARAEGERIDASLAELSAVVARRVSDDVSRPGRAAARPPDNFRADRFMGKERAG